MSYEQNMERCLNYIENHIQEKITVEELAELAGYSLYHFCRVFKSIYGISAGSYIRQRQLNIAAQELSDGGRITDIALSSGFDTPSGFTRAFRRQHGITPTEYKQKGGNSMTPKIKKMAAFSAVCYQLSQPDGEFNLSDYGAYWLHQDFSSVSKEDYAKLTQPGYAEIGIWLHPADDQTELCYYLGPTVTSKDFVPKGMRAIDIPEAQYAVFPVAEAANNTELNKNVCQAWKYIFSEWFDSSDWKYDERKLCFEYYLGKETYIYVPVISK